MNPEKFQSDDFLARWIAGELSPDERTAFEHWVEANPGEQRRFEQLRQVWDSYGNLRPEPGLSKKERWQQLCAITRLNTQSNNGSV